MLFVTSWDDGHPADLRIGDMLARHGMAGTFFVPGSNSEGRATLDLASRRELDAAFEVGSHTLDHVYLRGLPEAEVRHQIVEGKHRLEDELGHAVEGFCYPGGKLDKGIVKQVRRASFSYARTTQNFRLDAGSDRFHLPTSIQFYPHGRDILVRNLIRHGNLRRRTRPWLTALASPDWVSRLRRLATRCHAVGGVFHLWGHSWEIDEYGLWNELEQVLGWISDLNPEVATVAQLAASPRCADRKIPVNSSPKSCATAHIVIGRSKAG